jgi:hypothetical protein
MKRSPKNVRVLFSNDKITHFSGTFLLQKFFRKINLRSLFSHYVKFHQRNNRYSNAEEILSLLYPIILGLGRIEMTSLLKQNGVFQYLTGLPSYPNPTTLRRFLFRMAPEALPKLRRLHDKLSGQMISRPQLPVKVVLDLDSTVLTLYGQQEGAKVGYNPKKKGRPSYHPLLCFDGITKDFMYAELRPGNVHTSAGVEQFLQACFKKIPASMKTMSIRADKGFYGHQVIELLDKPMTSFVVVARLTQPIKSKLEGLAYRKYSSGLQTAEFKYQPANWLKKYRFVVIRRPIPEEASEQLTLFTLGSYSYQVLVTNLILEPINVWKHYNGRASVELIIRELKESYPLGKIPTKHFQANETYFHILLLGYNLINWFKRLCLPENFQNLTLNTLRYRLLLVPGLLVKSGNRPSLKIQASYPYKDVFRYAMQKIDKLKFQA